MSEPETQPTQTEPAQTEPAKPTSFPVSLVVVESGRTHGIAGGASFDLIRDDEGNPETEYVLAAEINGVPVPLQSYSKSVLDQLAASEKQRQENQQSG
jgi:hypothetical protein